MMLREMHESPNRRRKTQMVHTCARQIFENCHRAMYVLQKTYRLQVIHHHVYIYMCICIYANVLVTPRTFFVYFFFSSFSLLPVVIILLAHTLSTCSLFPLLLLHLLLLSASFFFLRLAARFSPSKILDPSSSSVLLAGRGEGLDNGRLEKR